MKRMSYPEIRFLHPWLLIDTIYPDIKAAYETPNDQLYKLDAAFISRSLRRYEKAWRPYEQKIISAMCDILGLEFRQNIIDIYVAPFYSSFSNPMFIATKYTADRAEEVITHEFIHRLLQLVDGQVAGRPRVRADLEDPRQRARSITEIALRWGFNDSAHFSRTFRARFGLSPRAVRGR